MCNGALRKTASRTLKTPCLPAVCPASSFAAHRFRLLLHAAAYVLLHALRGPLAATGLASAQFDTLRLRLLKVGARVRQSVRRVWVRAVFRLSPP